MISAGDPAFQLKTWSQVEALCMCSLRKLYNSESHFYPIAQLFACMAHGVPVTSYASAKRTLYNSGISRWVVSNIWPTGICAFFRYLQRTPWHWKRKYASDMCAYLRDFRFIDKVLGSPYVSTVRCHSQNRLNNTSLSKGAFESFNCSFDCRVGHLILSARVCLRTLSDFWKHPWPRPIISRSPSKGLHIC